MPTLHYLKFFKYHWWFLSYFSPSTEKATYNSLVKSACEGNLVIAGTVINLKDLRYLMSKSKILHNCKLLERLGLVVSNYNLSDQKNTEQKLKEYKSYIFYLVKSQICLSTQVIIQRTNYCFPELSESKI